MIGDEHTRIRARAHLERVRARRERQASRRRSRSEPASSWRAPSARPPGALGVAVFVVAFALGAAAARSAPASLATLAGGRAGRVERISVIGARHLSPEQVAGATGVAHDAPAAEVDSAAVVARLLANSWVADAHARLLPGGTLVVSVQERQPRAVLSVDGVPGERWVDASGRPFGEVDGDPGSELPHLVAGAPLATDQPDPALAAALDLAERAGAGELHLPVPGSDLGWVLRPRGSAAELVLGREALDERLARWKELLASGVVDPAAATRVDLRFADQAVLR